MYLWLRGELKLGLALGVSGLAACLASSPAASMELDYSGFASVVTGITRGACTPENASKFQYESQAWMVGVGRRIGKVVPMLTLSAYHETTRFPDDYEPAGWTTQSVSLRYEIGVSSAIKLQLDRFREDKAPFAGNSKVISASYDFIF